MKSKLLLVIFEMTLGLSLVGCSTSPNSNFITDNSNVEDVSSKTISVETSSVDTRSDYATIGQTITGDTFSISLLYAKQYSSITDGNIAETSDEGKVYLALFFEVKNISSDSANFNHYYNESYVDDLSVSYDDLCPIDNIDGYSTLGGTIPSQHKLKGYFAFQVPTNWKEFEYLYKKGIWTTHKSAKFEVSCDDLSSNDYIYNGSPFEPYVLDSRKITSIGTIETNEGWTVKLMNVKQYDLLGSEYLETTPSNGNVFVVFFIEVTNITSDDEYFNSLYLGQYSNGYPAKEPYIYEDVEGYNANFGSCAAGKKMQGYVAMEVSSSWSSIELIYSPILGMSDIEFAIIPTNLA